MEIEKINKYCNKFNESMPSVWMAKMLKMNYLN